MRKPRGSEKTDKAVAQVNKKTKKGRRSAKSVKKAAEEKKAARKAARKAAEKKAARKAARKAAEKKAVRKAAKKATGKKTEKQAAATKATRKKAKKKESAGKKSAKNKAERKRADKTSERVKWNAVSTARDAGQGGNKTDDGEPSTPVVPGSAGGGTVREIETGINRGEAAGGDHFQASFHEEVQKQSEELKKMSSDPAQAGEITPAKRTMGFWPKIVVAIVIIIAGFMYIRSVAERDRVMPVAEVAPPPAAPQNTAPPDEPMPVAAIQLEKEGAGDAVPVQIGSVITEEVPVVPAASPSETDEGAGQVESQAQVEPGAPAAAMQETTEAASAEPDQTAAEMPAPEPASVMAPPVISAPVAPVEPREAETAVAEQEPATEPAPAAEPVSEPSVDAAQAPSQEVAVEAPAPAPVEPSPMGSAMDAGAAYPGPAPHPSFEEMYGYDRPAPPEMPSRYDRFQGPGSQEQPGAGYQHPGRMMGRSFPGGMESRDYPARYPREYSRGYAPDFDQGYPGEGGYGYGPGYSRGYSSPGYYQGYAPGYHQGYAPGYHQGYAPGYHQGYAPGYSQGYPQGYPQDYSTPYPQGQNPYSGGYAPYRW